MKRPRGVALDPKYKELIVADMRLNSVLTLLFSRKCFDPQAIGDDVLVVLAIMESDRMSMDLRVPTDEVEVMCCLQVVPHDCLIGIRENVTAMKVCRIEM